MGFRFRKSIGNKFFRTTISKSGISYSAGIPGMRVTKLANKKIRTTTSIPGTGISYVKDYTTKNTATQNFTKQSYNYMLFGFIPTWIIDSKHYVTSITSKPIKSIHKGFAKFLKWCLLIPLEIVFWFISILLFSPMWYIGIMTLATAIILRNMRLSLNGLFKIMDNFK